MRGYKTTGYIPYIIIVDLILWRERCSMALTLEKIFGQFRTSPSTPKYDPSSYAQLENLAGSAYQLITGIQNDEQAVKQFAGFALYGATGFKVLGINICNLDEIKFTSFEQKSEKIKKAIGNFNTVIGPHFDWLFANVGSRKAPSSSGEPYEMLLLSNTAKLYVSVIWKTFLLIQFQPKGVFGNAELFALKSLRILSTVDGATVAGWVREIAITRTEPERSNILSNLNEKDWPPPSFLKLYFENHDAINRA
jgi:hypothetical protein